MDTFTIPLTKREALSGVMGSVSLACWLFLLIPQLIENYRQSSADAISLAFIFVWFVGDVANLWGALWADLVPTVIAIGVYFCIMDGVLIGQVMYYRIRNKRREGKSVLAAARESVVSDSARQEVQEANRNLSRPPRASNDDDEDETQPLLSRADTARRRSSGSGNVTITIPGSGTGRRPSTSSLRRRRSSTNNNHNEPLGKILEETHATGTRRWLRYIVSILGVAAVGALGWTIAYHSGAWRPTAVNNPHRDHEAEEIAVGAQVVGYVSALAYLGARVPQIVKNARDKSCEGLSLLFFILSLLGNATYGAGILFHDTRRRYVLKNLPWLIGSFGTMLEDATIFAQFRMYSGNGFEDLDGESDELEEESAVV